MVPPRLMAEAAAAGAGVGPEPEAGVAPELEAGAAGGGVDGEQPAIRGTAAMPASLRNSRRVMGNLGESLAILPRNHLSGIRKANGPAVCRSNEPNVCDC